MRSTIPAVRKPRPYALLRHWAHRDLCVPNALRNFAAALVLAPSLAIAGTGVEDAPIDDFYITVTASDLYLCGEGFGGIYGCIDEAVAREVESVVISASSDCSVEAVQELITAVHAVGFDRVGVASFSEPAP